MGILVKIKKFHVFLLKITQKEPLFPKSCI